MLTFLSKGTNINNILMAISLFRRVEQSVLGGSTHTGWTLHWNINQLAFCNNGWHDIATSKTMCNHNIISRIEKNRSNLAILQSFRVYVICSGNGSIFKSLNLIEFVWLEDKPCPPATFSHTNPLNISEIWTATKFYIPMLQTSNLAVLQIFSCSSHF